VRIPAPSNDAFYVPVPSGDLGSPGTVLRHRRTPCPAGVPARTWQVVHTTVGTTGATTAVSGTVLVPRRGWHGAGPRPLLTYGVGVHGLGRDSAPSHWLRRGRESEVAQIDMALSRGWAVAVTDGEGLGMPGPHTYGAGGVGGRAMLDVARAAAQLAPELAGAPVLAWGYSEGGRCAVFAAEQHPTYAPDLRLAAVAAGGVPSDLRAVARALDGGPFSGLNLAVLVGLAHAHDRPGLWEILTPAGRTAATRAAELDVVGLVLELPEPLSAHTGRNDAWDAPEWRSVLRDERAGQHTPEVPAYLYHVVDDVIVPHALRQELAAAYRAGGASVTCVDVVADDHLAGGQVGAEEAVAWLATQLGGHPEAPAAGQPMVASASLKVVEGRITAAAFSGSGRK
jgi:hypothetical protein